MLAYTYLSSEHAAEGAVVLLADLRHDLVHRPPIDVLIAKDRQRQPEVLLVLSHLLDGVVSVTLDSFVDAQKY